MLIFYFIFKRTDCNVPILYTLSLSDLSWKSSSVAIFAITELQTILYAAFARNFIIYWHKKLHISVSGHLTEKQMNIFRLAKWSAGIMENNVQEITV
jgi:hypothetical protein